MKKEIAKNEYYEVFVDEEINRVYWVFKGKWEKVMDVPNFMRDNTESLRYLKPGFTVLSDVRMFEMPSPEILEIMTEAAKISESAGMGRQAHVINKKDLKAVRASRNAMKEADLDLKMMQFGDYEEATAWLNK